MRRQRGRTFKAVASAGPSLQWRAMAGSLEDEVMTASLYTALLDVSSCSSGPRYKPRAAPSFSHRRHHGMTINHPHGKCAPMGNPGSDSARSDLVSYLTTAVARAIGSSDADNRGCCGRALPGIRIVGLAFGEDGPDNPRVFVGDRDQSPVVANARKEGDDPLFEPGALVR